MFEEKSTRFAELVGELMGAQGAKEILERIWVEASPETKRQLADSVMRRVLAEVESVTQYNQVIKSAVDARVKEILAQRGLPAEFDAKVIAKFDQYWDAYIEQAVRSSMQAMRDNVALRLRNMST